MKCPAVVRFVSAEPLLGPLVLPRGLDWVIAGGESGPGARPCHPDWIRGLRDHRAWRHPVFLQAMGRMAAGRRRPRGDGAADRGVVRGRLAFARWRLPNCDDDFAGCLHRVGKAKAGRCSMAHSPPNALEQGLMAGHFSAGVFKPRGEISLDSGKIQGKLYHYRIERDHNAKDGLGEVYQTSPAVSCVSGEFGALAGAGTVSDPATLL